MFKQHFADGLVMIELQGQLRVSNNAKLNGFDLGGLTLRKVTKHAILTIHTTLFATAPIKSERLSKEKPWQTKVMPLEQAT